MNLAYDPKEGSKDENEKKVLYADQLGLILAKIEPSIVKVLIDNSSLENLNVHLRSPM